MATRAIDTRETETRSVRVEPRPDTRARRYDPAETKSRVLTAANVVAADNGLGREQLGRITIWVCALFLAQGLVPIFRFGTRELPHLVAGHLKANARDMVLFVVLLIAGAMLFL